jgi:hypothetical protein
MKPTLTTESVQQQALSIWGQVMDMLHLAQTDKERFEIMEAGCNNFSDLCFTTAIALRQYEVSNASNAKMHIVPPTKSDLN